MKADPEPSRIASEVAHRLGIQGVKQNESALVRIGLEYCRKRGCGRCPFDGYCKKLEIKR